MKHTKRISVLLVTLLVVCFACLTLTACNKHGHYDPEQRPFTMAISTPDGVFNPFFSTSAYDSQIIAMTQIAMINTDKDGHVAVGDNEPTVVKAYTTTSIDNGTKTQYEFLIKNGIKWSDGTPLTINDVLFNLYVYLDPVYTGSATIYSTDIVGLQNYRLQREGDSIGDDEALNFESKFVVAANTRVNKVTQYVLAKSENKNSDDDYVTVPSGITEDEALADIAYVAKTFYKELLSDYNAINVEDYKNENFTEKWQIFLRTDGGDDAFLKREFEGGPYVRDPKTNDYQMDEEYAASYFNRVIAYQLSLKGFATDNGDGSYTVKPTTTDKEKENLENAIRDICVQLVFETNFTTYFPYELVLRTESKITFKEGEKEKMQQYLVNSDPYAFETIINYWGTAQTVFDKFTADAKTKHFAEGGKIVETIKGITTRKESVNFDNKTLNEEYDVLRIVINGVDPKAIFNFGFTVAPMHIYSTHFWSGNPGVDYIKQGNERGGNYAIEFGNSDFMSEVINDPDKIGLPVGGGTYMASTEEGTATAKTFFNNNTVYYERNPYFYTLFGLPAERAAEGNAKIKYMRYSVVASDKILNSLIQGTIDLGEPSAIYENQKQLEGKGLEISKVQANGYGYVGINPRFIPEVNIRRAIMLAMNVEQLKDNYYKGNFCEIIKRPMTMASWAYPKSASSYVSGNVTVPIGTSGQIYEFDSVGDDIDRLVADAGYEDKGGKAYEKNIAGFGRSELSYKFTIAGGSTDHPAYAMFLAAAKLLNAHGFDIKVVTSQQALSDLSAGKLAVWAAAWSSTVDPDMFQVYHKDSQASSVKNWGYAQILGDTAPEAWEDEKRVIVALSEIIDQARSTEDEKARTPLYHTALDLVMELAVEFPTYQRYDLTGYQSGLLNPATLPKEITPYSGLLARIWEINYYL